MSNPDKSKKLSDDVRELSQFTEQQRLGHGKIEFDELGNAVWVPNTTVSGAEVMARLLDDPTLAITQDNSSGSNRLVKQNPQGLKKGYDPYDSGMLAKQQFKKTKDLRKLSAWIQSRKSKED